MSDPTSPDPSAEPAPSAVAEAVPDPIPAANAPSRMADGPSVPLRPSVPLHQKVRRIALPIVLLGGVALLGGFGNFFYPIQHWMFWIYARAWLSAAVWAFACAGVGHLIVKRILGRTLPFMEHTAASFAAGVYAFFVLMFIGGLFRIYGTVFFFALPLAMLAVSARPWIRYLRRYARHLAHKRSGARAASQWWTYALFAFGLIGLLMVYFVLLTPHNVQFDSRWKHIAVAEEYVAYGGMRRSDEGWTVVTYPHLASFLYAWGFMSPKASLFTKVEIAAHIEFVVFLGSVWSISALAKYLVPKADTRLAWVARFLFPGVFLYDSSVSLGADHVAALFVAPIFLFTARAWKDLDPRTLVLAVMMLAAGVLVKYTSLLMLFPLPVAIVLVRGAWFLLLKVRGKLPANDVRVKNWYLGPLVALGAGLLFTAPHWAKNLVWYRDPLYPQLHSWITPNPWTQDSADLFEWGYKDYQFWRPTRDVKGVLLTLRALVDFSFVPNDYGRFHGKMPVFGSLYTLSLACLPFLAAWRLKKSPTNEGDAKPKGPGTLRIWGLVAFVEASVLVWYWTHHQDRYLQTLLPWLAGATAATFVLVWRAGWAARIALGLLVGLQIVWGGDVYFIQTHAMIRSPIKAVADLLAAGYKGERESRFKIFSPYSDIGAALPKEARVLLHDNHVHIGINHSQVSDWGGWQFGISYGRLKTPGEVFDLYKKMGVTHLLWDKQVSKGWDSVAGDLMFFHFALGHGKEPKSYGSTLVAKMPEERPSDDEWNDNVAFLGCNELYKAGLYKLSDLTTPVFGPERRKFAKPRRAAPKKGDSTEDLVDAAAFVVLDPKCHKLSGANASLFTLAAKRLVIRRAAGASKYLELYVRKSGSAPVPVQLDGPKSPATDGPDEPEDEPFGDIEE